jgi:uncharacterized membrane protein YkvA (DUF1232 family)
MGLWLARFRIARTVLRNGRLAWRLMRDSRTPLKAKLILGAALLYLISPINLLNEWIPLVGQLDDIAVITLGFELFFRNVPEWLKAEHEAAMGRRPPAGQRVIDV